MKLWELILFIIIIFLYLKSNSNKIKVYYWRGTNIHVWKTKFPCNGIQFRHTGIFCELVHNPGSLRLINVLNLKAPNPNHYKFWFFPNKLLFLMKQLDFQ